METIHLSFSAIQITLTIMAFFISGGIAILRVGYLLGEHEKKIRDEFKKEISESIGSVSASLSEAVKAGDTKRARIYERLDEYKNFAESQFVRREMCGIMHSSTAQEVGKIYGRMDGFDKKFAELDDKLDNLKTLIIQRNG